MIDYSEEWLLLTILGYRGSVAGRASLFAVPSSLFALGLLILDDEDPAIREDSFLHDLGNGVLWKALTATLFFLVTFRTNLAMQRFWEGTGLMHQMRGEWFDTCSNCVTFSVGARSKKPEEVMAFRHTLVRLMSLAHGNALEEISDNQFKLKTIDPGGLDSVTMKFLTESHELYNFNKVEVNLHLIQTLITRANADGILGVPPPIVSRVYQTISRGFVNLLISKKITDTKFPYPYVQLLILMMTCFTFLTPVYLTTIIPNKVIAMVTTFLPTFTVAAFYYISVELENPFGRDDNDLPLEHFQAEMDNCLLMLLHPEADSVPIVKPTCEMDFQELMTRFQPECYRGVRREHARRVSIAGSFEPESISVSPSRAVTPARPPAETPTQTANDNVESVNFSQ